MNEIFKIDDEYSFLTKELLTKEYVENKLTDRQIAQKYNIKSKTTVWRRRKFLNIQNSFQNKSNQNACKNRIFNISKDDVFKDISNGLTYIEIADKMGCSRMVAYRRMKELGLIEDQFKTMSGLKRHEKLSEKQMKFLLGCMLGDGNMNYLGMFQCSHSDKQLEYIKYKKDILSTLLAPNFDLVYSEVKNNQNGKTYYSYFLRTMSNENIKAIYNKFYTNKIKVFPYEYLIGSNFDAYSLAIWYMDDGSISNKSASLQTQGFNYDENIKISEFLYKKFSIISSLQKISSKTRVIPEEHSHYIRLNVENSHTLFKIIDPFVLPCFRYKLSCLFRSV